MSKVIDIPKLNLSLVQLLSPISISSSISSSLFPSPPPPIPPLPNETELSSDLDDSFELSSESEGSPDLENSFDLEDSYEFDLEESIKYKKSKQSNQIKGDISNIMRYLKKFEFIKKINNGEFSKVYLAKDIEKKEERAIKLVEKTKYHTDADIISPRERAELYIHSKISHPNIIKLYEYYEDEDLQVYVMEYAPNGDLFDLLKERTKISQLEAVEYIRQISIALNYCKQNNIIHRDIKPENILLDKDNNIKLIDFGYSTQKSESTRICGTKEYISPEMLLRKKYDYKVDIWSLGVMLYELLYGHTPFSSLLDDDYKLVNRIIRTDILFPPTIQLSLEIKKLILFMLNRDPNQRPDYEYIIRYIEYLQVLSR